MKVAFTGKGGSGKSTLSSLFIQYLLREKRLTLAIDADINVHLGHLLDVPIDESLALSSASVKAAVRKILRGTNPRIETAAHFVKTTPPGTGSTFVRVDPSDQVLTSFATSFAGGRGHFMHVGTYEEEEIGTSCYHGNLTILENLLSHTIAPGDEWVVTDMVAGTDAFSGSLHLQFDLIFVVVEPTPEGVSVFRQYDELSRAAGTREAVALVGNKVDGDDDLAYLKSELGEAPVAIVPHQRGLRRARQQGRIPTLDDLDDVFAFDALAERAKTSTFGASRRQELLNALHLKHAQEDYIVARVGDVSGQIDPSFDPSALV